MKYRKEIDGLRAIAILPVIWIHSGLPYLTGGFLGVDVFFVISGFLITSIILKEFHCNNFSLLTFYRRRARRILPALFTVVALTTIASLFISIHPKFIADYGASLLSTILFYSNIYFWQTSGYFGTASELSPLLHTWSLAVEEQFYIFFPILIILLYRYGTKVILGSLILIAILSLLISKWGAVNSPIGNFYLLPSRVWELMAGSIASMVYSNSHILRVRAKFSALLSCFGISLILFSYFFFTPTTLHPSTSTLLPVLGAVLVLMFADQNNHVGRLLSISIASFVGLISYSLYLWHQPVLALMKNLYSVHLMLSQVIVAIILIFVLSFLTWKYVESPFRNRNTYSDGKVFKITIVTSVIFILSGFILKNNFHIQALIFPKDMARYEKMKNAEDSFTNQVMYDKGCRFWSSEFNTEFTERFDACAKIHGKAIFILGGSHGMDLYNAIASNASAPFIVSVSRGYCRAHKFLNPQKRLPRCQYEDFELFASQRKKNISYVIYTQAPYRLFKTTGKHLETDDLSIESVEQVISYLVNIKESYSLNVLMIGMLPSLAIAPINWDYGQPFSEQYKGILSENSEYLSKYVDNVFQKKLEKFDLPYISKITGFNLDMPKDLVIDGEITYSDKTHLSYKGETVFGRRLVNHLSREGYEGFTVNK